MTLSLIHISPDPTPNPTPDPEPEPTTGSGKILVAYFSCTNTTKGIADDVADLTSGTLYRIEPETPYTSADLNYNTDCRANREQNDPKARPAINGAVENIADYDIVFLGYPIWWGAAPKVIYTFLEKHNLDDKIIIPFCTSHSSGIGSSDTNLHSLATNVEWKPGKRFGANETKANIRNWIEEMCIRDRTECEYRLPADFRKQIYFLEFLFKATVRSNSISSMWSFAH